MELAASQATKKVTWSLCAMKTYGGVAVYPPLITFAVDGDEWSASRPCRYTPGDIAPGTHFIGGWVCPRVGQEAVVKSKI
jgi:hypothetical protein